MPAAATVGQLSEDPGPAPCRRGWPWTARIQRCPGLRASGDWGPGDLAVTDRGERLWSAADARRQPHLMGGPDAASRRRAADDTAVPERGFTVTIGERAGGLAYRVEAPGRLLRIWSLLQATHEEIDHATVPPERVSALQRQLRAIRCELEDTISPALVTELRRIAPPSEDAPSAARLRIECAILTSWTGALTIEMLDTIEAVGSHLSRQSAPASAKAGGRPERGVVDFHGLPRLGHVHRDRSPGQEIQ